MDTTADAERVRAELLRSVPASRRAHLAWALSAAVITAARRAIARADPDAGQMEWDVRFVALHYGSALAASVRAELMSRGRRGTARSQ